MMTNKQTNKQKNSEMQIPRPIIVLGDVYLAAADLLKGLK